ncbi:MAG: rRNA maturation RNase YbeY [Oscillospiraceae bacterium]|nr:rRNA maturation RNase YbeY [Oscillospiraceae bacterium]
MNKVKLSLLNEFKGAHDIPDKKMFKEWIKNTLIVENIVENVEISVLLTDNERIRRLNKEFRKIDSSTDVLSFPMGGFVGGYYNLGDIAINVERAAEQAHEYGHSLVREFAFLTIHSTLHLLGYDHIDDESDREMRSKQSAILDALGLSIAV